MLPFKSMKINFATTKEKMRFSGTEGDWTDDGQGNYEVWVLKLSSFIFMLSVLSHELIEIGWCWLHGVTAKEADAFDSIWYGKKDVVDENIDYGIRKDCPYRGGHMWGIRMEQLVIFIFGGVFGFRKLWKEYGKACDKAILEQP
jgi:hypothetical protein